MNIFVLDTDIETCARYHCDQHVIKMILESAQMLCTVLSKKGFQTPYRPTHAQHPCIIWLEESYVNFAWLIKLAQALNREYRLRFNKENNHKSIEIIDQISSHADEGLFYNRKMTPFAQVMPDKYRVHGDAVQAYRNYYRGEKLAFALWRHGPRPDIFKTSN